MEEISLTIKHRNSTIDARGSTNHTPMQTKFSQDRNGSYIFSPGVNKDEPEFQEHTRRKIVNQ